MISISKYLEHTLLKPDSTQKAALQCCEEALEHGFGAVCIPPLYIREARRILGEGPVRLATVVGFPMGYSSIAAKSEEIKRAVDEGADEIDAVINIAAVKSDLWIHVERDIDSLFRATNIRGRVLKLILECGMLTDEEIKKTIAIAHEKEVPFLKTGTGMFDNPATPDMVKNLRAWAPANMKIKAAGGIRTREQVEALIAAGADRIGSSNCLNLISNTIK
jgi:deoxyribose-phosphate aldolase